MSEEQDREMLKAKLEEHFVNQSKLTREDLRAVQCEQPFFCYDPEDGLTFHDTAEQARTQCQQTLKVYRDCAVQDGWPEVTDQACWGEVRERITKTEHIPRPPASEINEEGEDSAGNDWSNSDFSYIASYELRAARGLEPEEGAPKPCQYCQLCGESLTGCEVQRGQIVCEECFRVVDVCCFCAGDAGMHAPSCGAALKKQPTGPQLLADALGEIERLKGELKKAHQTIDALNQAAIDAEFGGEDEE